MDEKDTGKVNNTPDESEEKEGTSAPAEEKPADEETPAGSTPAAAEGSGEATDSFEDIMEGISSLERAYSNGESEREREMRLRDEKRREEEMAAIREDIERRYTLQVEEARSNMDSIVNRSSAGISASQDSQTLDLDAFNAADISQREKKRALKAEKKKAKKEAREARKKPPVYFDMDEKSGVYAYFYTLGEVVIRSITHLVAFILHLISVPVAAVRKYLRSALRNLRRRNDERAKATVREVIYFRKEIKSANKSIIRALRNPFSIPPIVVHYIAKAVRRHRYLLNSAANIIMPVVSVIILIATFSYWNSVTFALNVIYNDRSIGYISDESVFIEAKDMVSKRMHSGEIKAEVTEASSGNLDAGYKLALVSLDELNDARTISDRMIENSSENLTNACGIYINGSFLCAVKNESDAKTVFYNILEPYRADAAAKGYSVTLNEDIDYVQGLYRDDPAVMWDAAHLEATVMGYDGAVTRYTVAEEDTVESIAAAYGVTEEYLLSINPQIEPDDITAGADIVVPSGERMVNIRKTVKTSRVAPIPFDTVTTKDATRYSGYRLVRQQGVDGTQRIITTRIYINGELTDTTVGSEVITPAVDEQVIVGTRTTYGGIYIGMASDKGFLWPAPSCHYISSPYGWRSSGWHKGVDICTGNGTAYGTPVIASRSGTVEVVQRSDSGYGNMVLINHGDGYKTRYAHMIAGSITVRAGEYVEGGKAIGKVGSTGNSSGPHLHFEVIYNGETRNPSDYISVN